MHKTEHFCRLSFQKIKCLHVVYVANIFKEKIMTNEITF